MAVDGHSTSSQALK